MDSHWEWSDGDDADTADLGGDGGHELHGGFEADYGGDFGAEHLHDGFGADEHDLGGGHLDAHPGGDDLEEPLGTEHATADYDQAMHDAGAEHDGAGDPGVEHDPGAGHDPGADPGHDAGHDPAQDEPQAYEHGHEAGAEHHEAAFGTDPDVHAGADDPAWHEAQFPEELHLQDPPEPVDGFPWTDADVLGGPDHNLSAAFDPAVAEHGPAEPAGLADYAGVEVPPGTDPWSLLLGSEDPATSSLATFWAPQ